ncbi:MULTISPECIES: hypothetical protein [unclassified Streptomyces]|nr:MULTISPECIES: hypothetical protein [unclassified Streptomyces]MCX4527498.1 hypothetical protein [Streptomyces sp. NBC_01551]MCX4541921.1 hypothetical protein [Streptomyces sp. NBC_01565]
MNGTEQLPMQGAHRVRNSARGQGNRLPGSPGAGAPTAAEDISGRA